MDLPLLFLASWLVPTWLVFEFIPTKLTNYVFPLYPALSLMVACYLVRFELEGHLIKINQFLWIIFTALFCLLIFNLESYVDGDRGVWSYLTLLIFIVCISLTCFRYKQKRGVVLALCFGLASLPVVYGKIIPNLENLHLTVKLVKHLDNKYQASNIVVSGYREPSLVFAFGKDLQIAKSAEQAYAKLIQDCKNILVIDDREEEGFLKLAKDKAKLLSRVKGIDYTHFRWSQLSVFQNSDITCGQIS